MVERADAHIHLFDGGFQGSFTKRPGVKVDETALYTSLAKSHNVKRALVVCYEGEAWAAGNNAFVARLAPEHDWVAPVAYVEPSKPPSIDVLEHFREQRFVGLSFYIFGSEKVAALHRISSDVWEWLTNHRWLISVNSKGKDWSAWLPILKDHRELRICASHLGLPPRAANPPTTDQAREGLEVRVLAEFPRTCVKLSGFYAISDPGHDYPHEAAWPYVEALIEDFGVQRLLWGSDFSPSLDSLSFPQTFGVFSKIKRLSEPDRTKIEGGNLLTLLREAQLP